ncbi:MAG: DUF1285 domain-containing protein [Pseudomonadota bacterium]
MNSTKSLEALSAEIAALSKTLPPVHSWSPSIAGRIDIRIDEEGHWYHEGKRIEREAMVVLFASILRRDGVDDYALVTPVERLSISVEDVPFLVVDVELAASDAAEPNWVATTSLGEQVVIDADHPLRGRQSRRR